MKIAKLQFNFAVLIIASGLGFACGTDHSAPGPKAKPTTTSTQSDPDGSASAQSTATPAPSPTSSAAVDENVMKADKLADEGEALIQNASSFNEASGKFAQAIQTNPANNRAVFWGAFLKSALQLKGILNRIKPLYMNPQYAPAGRYEKLVHQQTENATQDVSSFLLDGPEDISTPELLQSWMDQFDNSIFEFRHSIKQIRDSEITILLPKILLPESLRVSQSIECSETDFGPIRYQDQNCSLGNGSRMVGVNRGDFEAVLAALALYQARIELMTAYRINPAAIVGIDSAKFNTKAEAQEAIRKLLNPSTAGGGKLRGAHPFTGIRELSNDMVVSLKYFLDHQSDLCPKGYAMVNNRKGYLLNFGVCENEQLSAYQGEAAEMHEFESYFSSQPLLKAGAQHDEASFMRKSLNTLTSALQGDEVDISRHFAPDDPQVILKPLKLLDSPPGDLMTMTPVTLDSCGDVTAINEQSIADDFVKGSFTDLLRQTARRECHIRIPKPPAARPRARGGK